MCEQTIGFKVPVAGALSCGNGGRSLLKVGFRVYNSKWRRPGNLISGWSVSCPHSAHSRTGQAPCVPACESFNLDEPVSSPSRESCPFATKETVKSLAKNAKCSFRTANGRHGWRVSGGDELQLSASCCHPSASHSFRPPLHSSHSSPNAFSFSVWFAFLP